MASVRLDEDQSRLYFDLILSSLGEAARRALQTMDPATYELGEQLLTARTLQEALGPT